MGYANTLETIITSEITSTKTSFPFNSVPQIQVTGENKTTNNAYAELSSQSIVTLQYAKSLLSFSAEIITESQTVKPIINKPTLRGVGTIRCNAESIGIPEIKPGVTVALAGLGSKFSKSYVVEKSVHSIGNSGFRTVFDSKTN